MKGTPQRLSFRHDRGLTEEMAIGAGTGNLQADAAASAEEKGRQMRAAIQNGNS